MMAGDDPAQADGGGTPDDGTAEPAADPESAVSAGDPARTGNAAPNANPTQQPDPGSSVAEEPEQPGESAVRPVEVPLEYRTYEATRAQAKASWIAAGVGAAALVMSLLALVSQWQLNTQQAELNRRSIEQDEQVYAAAVAVWALPGRTETSVLPPGLQVTVQNAAQTPIFNVYLLAPVVDSAGGRADAVLPLRMIPPCSRIQLQLAPPERSQFARSSVTVTAGVAVGLVFSETDRVWSLRSGRLILNDPVARSVTRSAQTMTPLRAFEPVNGPIPGCT